MKKNKEKRYKYMIIIFLAAFITSLAVFFYFRNDTGLNVTADNDYIIVPKPLLYVPGKGEFTFKEATSIYVAGNTEEETEEIAKIAEYFKGKIKPATGLELPIIKSQEVPVGSVYLTTIDGKEDKGNEGYEIITSPENIKVIAYRPEGLSRAVQTLRQMLPTDVEKDTLVPNVKWSISSSTIEDKPEYEYRGLMIDVARHFFTLDEIKGQIENAAQFKINKVHLHLSDDQGWPLEIKKWPDLAKIGGSTKVGGGTGGYYTQEEFIDLVNFAQERYVEIIPEFDMPGHSNAALASYGFLNPDGKNSSKVWKNSNRLGPNRYFSRHRFLCGTAKLERFQCFS